MSLPNDGVFTQVERVFLPKWRSWINCVLALPSRVPLQIAYYRQPKFKRRAIELMGEHEAVLAHLIRTGDAIRFAPGIKFLEMTDAISLNYKRIRKTLNSNSEMRAHVYALEAKRVLQYEKKIVDYFDHSFLVSEIDRQYLFNKLPDQLSKVSVFSNGVALDLLPYQFDCSGRDVIFIGNMFSLQNLDAALYMASEVMPLIRNVHPDVRLRLIGRIHPEKIAQLSKYDGVDVTGEVASVADAARGAAVGVCPLRLGAGVQNKILEYMALGLPTISTSIGLEGFSAQEGTDLLVADDPTGFAANVLYLIENRHSASKMATEARRYVESHHSWEAILTPMIELIRQTLSNRSDKTSLKPDNLDEL